MERMETLLQCVVCYVGFMGTLLFMSGVAGGWVTPARAEAAATESLSEAIESKPVDTEMDDAGNPVQRFIYEKVGRMLEHAYN